MRNSIELFLNEIKSHTHTHIQLLETSFLEPFIPSSFFERKPSKVCPFHSIIWRKKSGRGLPWFSIPLNQKRKPSPTFQISGTFYKIKYSTWVRLPIQESWPDSFRIKIWFWFWFQSRMIAHPAPNQSQVRSFSIDLVFLILIFCPIRLHIPWCTRFSQ